MMKLEKMQSKCIEISAIMKAISHPQRLLVLCHLSAGEKNVSELMELCQISQSQLSQFLKRMQGEKLVHSRREGGYSYYRIANKNIIRLINSMQKIFC